MKKIYLLFYIIISQSSTYAQFNIATFGAIGDAKTLNTQAIQQAIDKCTAQGGGVVKVPKGVFLTGTIVLKTGVKLEITEGGILLGSSKREDYQKNDWYALILAKGQKNISITGKGIIDGQGKDLAADVERMRQAGLIKNVKPHNRPDENHRPQIIEMTDCDNVRIEGVTIKNAACWVQTYHNCTYLKIHKIRVESTAYWNNDGIDIVDCRHVKITDCFINSADDAICLKSHDAKLFCEDIEIARCTLRSSASAFKLGTASYGGFKNIRVKNLYIYDTYRSAIALECVDGGFLENIKIKNIVAKNTGNALFIRIGHRLQSRPIGRVKDISIKNLKADIPKAQPDKGYDMEGPRADSASNLLPSSIVGLPQNPIKNVFLSNIDITYGGGSNKDKAYIPVTALSKVPEHPKEYPEFSMFGELPAWGFFLRHTEGVHFKNITLKLIEPDYRPAIVADDALFLTLKKMKISEGGGEPKVYFQVDKKTLPK
jgi:polygalacturonase